MTEADAPLNMKRRHAILLLGGASSGALSVGTGAFSSVEAERGVAVNVVDDENAYVGLKQIHRYPPVDGDDIRTAESAGHEPNDVVRITNQFSDLLDLSVTVDSTGGIVDEADIGIDDALEDGSELGIGGEAFVSIECDDEGSGHVELRLDGEASGASVEASRRFELSCLDVDFNGQSGNGNGNNGGGTVHISGFSGTLDVTVNGESSPRTVTSNGNGPAVLTPNEGRIESVSIDGILYERDDNDNSQNNND